MNDWENTQSIATRLVELLRQQDRTVATCESCTGGLISKSITDIAGSSAVFGYGVCTYANQAKEKLLGVKHETLERYGAVSEQTAIEMAKGMLALSNADIAVSTTGIAGPDGGTDEKPVGLVYSAIACRDGYLRCNKLLLGTIDNACRRTIREEACRKALLSVIEYLENDRGSGA